MRISTWTVLLVLTFIIPLSARESDREKRLSVFFTNDIHGGVVPQKAEFLNPEFPPLLGGGASVAAIIKKVRNQDNSNTLLIDGGDTYQGTLVGTLSRGKAMVAYLNRMQYDAVVPGNHDFDLGKDNLIELIKASEFDWVSCNIYNSDTGEPWEWVKPWVIKEKLGLKIGITGVTTAGTQVMSFPDNIRGLEFRSEIPVLQQAVDALRAEGVDLVVALVHVGLPYDVRQGYQDLQQQTAESIAEDRHIDAMEIAHFVRGIDILLGGHLHRGYTEPWVDPVNHTICLQNYANGGNLGWVDLMVDLPTRTIAGYKYVADRNALLLLQQDQFWPDSAMQKFVSEQQAIYEAQFLDVIGETRSALNRSSIGEAPLNNLICDVVCERTGSDVSFMNFGGIRADIKGGPLTSEDIFKVLPFGNEIVSFQIPGTFLKQLVERKLAGGSRGMAIGGARVQFNKELPDGERIVSMEVGGRPLHPDSIYRVATSDYLLEGNSGLFMLKRIPRDNVQFTGVLIRDALIEYIRRNSPLDIKPDGRWRQVSDKPDSEWRKSFQN